MIRVSGLFDGSDQERKRKRALSDAVAAHALLDTAAAHAPRALLDAAAVHAPREFSGLRKDSEQVIVTAYSCTGDSQSICPERAGQLTILRWRLPPASEVAQGGFFYPVPPD